MTKVKTPMPEWLERQLRIVEEAVSTWSEEKQVRFANRTITTTTTNWTHPNKMIFHHEYDWYCNKDGTFPLLKGELRGLGFSDVLTVGPYKTQLLAYSAYRRKRTKMETIMLTILNPCDGRTGKYWRCCVCGLPLEEKFIVQIWGSVPLHAHINCAEFYVDQQAQMVKEKDND